MSLVCYHHHMNIDFKKASLGINIFKIRISLEFVSLLYIFVNTHV